MVDRRIIGAGMLVLAATACSAAPASTGPHQSTSPEASAAGPAAVGLDTQAPPPNRPACDLLPPGTVSGLVHQPVADDNSGLGSENTFSTSPVCFYTVGQDPTGNSFFNIQIDLICGANASGAWQQDSSHAKPFTTAPVPGALISEDTTNPDGATAYAHPSGAVVDVHDVGAGTSGTLGADGIDTGLEPLLGRFLATASTQATAQHPCDHLPSQADASASSTPSSSAAGGSLPAPSNQADVGAAVQGIIGVAAADALHVPSDDLYPRTYIASDNVCGLSLPIGACLPTSPDGQVDTISYNPTVLWQNYLENNEEGGPAPFQMQVVSSYIEYLAYRQFHRDHPDVDMTTASDHATVEQMAQLTLCKKGNVIGGLEQHNAMSPQLAAYYADASNDPSYVEGLHGAC